MKNSIFPLLFLVGCLLFTFSLLNRKVEAQQQCDPNETCTFYIEGEQCVQRYCYYCSMYWQDCCHVVYGYCVDTGQSVSFNYCDQFCPS